MTDHPFIDLAFDEYPEAEMQSRASSFYAEMKRRRSVREFSSRPIPDGIIEECLRTAGTAVSGANLQPWHFCVVRDPSIKHQIRLMAELEERKFYASKAPKEWLDALAPLGTDPDKPFLEIAPVLIGVFQQRYGLGPDGKKVKHYYAPESVGIATGFLIAALHHAGLACLTHTPSPMGFLNTIMERPKNERPFVLMVAGYPTEQAKVPDITKKPLSEIVSYL